MTELGRLQAARGDADGRGGTPFRAGWRLLFVGGCCALAGCASTTVTAKPAGTPVFATTGSSVASSSGAPSSGSAIATSASSSAVSSGDAGQSTGGTVALTGSPTPPLAQSPVVVHVGLSANGQRVDLQIGQRLEVSLDRSWTPPRVEVQDVGATLQPLRVDSAQGYPADVQAFGWFTAVRRGTTTITAHTDYACLHAAPRCAVPTKVFTLTVVVVPPSGQGAGPLPVPAPS
jgi:hypothetical protein